MPQRHPLLPGLATRPMNGHLSHVPFTLDIQTNPDGQALD